MERNREREEEERYITAVSGMAGWLDWIDLKEVEGSKSMLVVAV